MLKAPGRGRDEWKSNGWRFTPIPQKRLHHVSLSEWHGMLLPKVEEGHMFGEAVVNER